MKIKYILTVIATVAITRASFAQYSQDALRFSTFQPGSTSRVKAIGNASTAIGGDLSSVSGNPAGIGFFTGSEFSITPEFNMSKVKSNYFGTAGSAKTNDANLNNASVVFYSRLNTPKGADKTKGWLSLNFGASYNRTNNFYQNTYYTGKNTGTNGSNGSSVADYYSELANAYTGALIENSLESWAEQQSLIGYDAANDVYAPNTAFNPTQSSTVNREGGQSELSFSMGGNYSNKFYLGAGIGITNIRYNSTSYLTEVNNEFVNINREFTSTYRTDQVTKGTGFNARLGFIYKPDNAVRIGATLTTPTWYNIDDTFSERLNTNYTGGSNYGDGPVSYPFSYNLRTPLKLTGGLAVFIKQYGFISGDIEYQDYSTMHLSGDYNYDDDNNRIKNMYKSTVNARIGAEARIDKLFLRGGYGMMGNPRKEFGSDTKTTSGGLGYRFGKYYVDATYTHVTGSQTVFPYEIASNSPSAELRQTSNNVFLTLGLRF
jgi:hypothetical protein